MRLSTQDQREQGVSRREAAMINIHHVSSTVQPIATGGYPLTSSSSKTTEKEENNIKSTTNNYLLSLKSGKKHASFADKTTFLVRENSSKDSNDPANHPHPVSNPSIYNEESRSYHVEEEVEKEDDDDLQMDASATYFAANNEQEEEEEQEESDEIIMMEPDDALFTNGVEFETNQDLPEQPHHNRSKSMPSNTSTRPKTTTQPQKHNTYNPQDALFGKDYRKRLNFKIMRDVFFDDLQDAMITRDPKRVQQALKNFYVASGDLGLLEQQSSTDLRKAKEEESDQNEKEEEEKQQNTTGNPMPVSISLPWNESEDNQPMAISSSSNMLYDIAKTSPTDEREDANGVAVLPNQTLPSLEQELRKVLYPKVSAHIRNDLLKGLNRADIVRSYQDIYHEQKLLAGSNLSEVKLKIREDLYKDAEEDMRPLVMEEVKFKKNKQKLMKYDYFMHIYVYKWTNN